MLESYVGVWASGHSRKGVIGYAASRVCRRQQDVGERRVSYKRGTDASWTRPDADDENRDEKERTLWRETEMRTRLYRQRPPEHRAGQHGFLPPSSSSSPGLACGPGWAAANGLRPCWGVVDEHKPTRGFAMSHHSPGQSRRRRLLVPGDSISAACGLDRGRQERPPTGSNQRPDADWPTPAKAQM